jgi:hypothetical protein
MFMRCLITAAATLIVTSTRAATTAPATTAPSAGMAVYVGDELMRDYSPKPTLVTKQTLIDKPRFPVIDIHCHWSLQQDPRALFGIQLSKDGLRRAQHTAFAGST